jgi:two-component system alkaline phosphatase synthesis response regulator PhoP
MVNVGAKKIFLIDDEKPMTQLVSTLLGLNGFTFASENDAEAGLKRLLAEDCDAIIVDLMMPRLDGLTLIGTLRDSPRHGKTPILVLSAKSLTDSERKSLLGFNVRFLPKPITPSRLLAAVREL